MKYYISVTYDGHVYNSMLYDSYEAALRFISVITDFRFKFPGQIDSEHGEITDIKICKME